MSSSAPTYPEVLPGTPDEWIGSLTADDVLRPGWMDCPFCGAHRRRTMGLCAVCQRLDVMHSQALSELDIIGFSGNDEPWEMLVRRWKDHWRFAPGSAQARRGLALMTAP